MNKKYSFKMILLAVLLLVVAAAAFPITTAQAAGLQDEGTPPDNTRLETAWARQLNAYLRAEQRISNSSEMISKVQTLINKAAEKGWDASAVQAALDAYAAAIQNARPLINSANGIVTSHKGFDDSGKVTDRAQALETIKELGQHLKEARAAMGGSGQALRETVQAFRAAHRPTTTP